MEASLASEKSFAYKKRLQDSALGEAQVYEKQFDRLKNRGP